MSEQVIKPAKSFEGWEFKKWLLGNAKTIKEFLKVGIPALIGWISTNNPELTVLATLLGKFILDTAEYYIKEKTA